LPLSFDKLRMVSLAEPFFKEGYKGPFVLLEPITEGLLFTPPPYP
jgi:hypothetical protein